MIQIHTDDWAAALCRDFDHAQSTIVLTALSINAPLPSTKGALRDFWASLRNAAKAGVQVIIITPAPTIHHPATTYNAKAARYAAAHGMRCNLIALPHLLHAKTALIDTEIAWIGSGNFTQAAMMQNREAYCRTDDPEAIHELISLQDRIIDHTPKGRK